VFKRRFLMSFFRSLAIQSREARTAEQEHLSQLRNLSSLYTHPHRASSRRTSEFQNHLTLIRSHPPPIMSSLLPLVNHQAMFHAPEPRPCSAPLTLTAAAAASIPVLGLTSGWAAARWGPRTVAEGCDRSATITARRFLLVLH